MKIIYVNNLFAPNIVGGAEKIVQSLAHGMYNRGHEIVVITLICPSENMHVRHIEGIKVYYIPLSNIYWPFDGQKRSQMRKILWHLKDAWNVKMSLTVSQIIEEENPDVIHLHNLSGFSTAILHKLKDRFPTILTLHDYYFKCYRSTMFKNNKNCQGQCRDCMLLSLPRRIVSRKIGDLIGVSDFVLKRMTSTGYFTNSVKSVIHNSVSIVETRDKIVNNGRILRIGYIGRITEEKGFRTIIEALEGVTGEWQFIFAGAGDEELIHSALGRFPVNATYLGFVKPVDFYSEVDILVIPSLWNDPYPTVGLEALSAGIPVLGRRVGGIPEIVGKFSEKFIFETTFELTQKINEVIMMNVDERNKILGNLSEIYNFENYLDKYEEKYVTAANKN